jgi:hypothetical protein
MQLNMGIIQGRPRYELRQKLKASNVLQTITHSKVTTALSNQRWPSIRSTTGSNSDSILGFDRTSSSILREEITTKNLPKIFPKCGISIIRQVNKVARISKIVDFFSNLFIA